MSVLDLNNQEASFSKKTAQLSFILSIPFLIVAFANFFQWTWLNKIDTAIGQAIIQYRGQGLTTFFRHLTKMGNVGFSAMLIGIIVIVLFLMLNDKHISIWYLLTTAIGAGALNQIVKYLFQKDRPTVEHLIDQGGYSFPSGHAMGSIIIYGALLYIVFKLINNQVIKTLALVATMILVGLIGLSRVYLGVHFPSDIIGGYALGAAWLTLSIGLFEMQQANK